LVLVVLVVVLVLVRRAVLLYLVLLVLRVVGMAVAVPLVVREALAVVAGTLQTEGLALLDKDSLVAMEAVQGQLMLEVAVEVLVRLD
jgi:hypothetical protein